MLKSYLQHMKHQANNKLRMIIICNNSATLQIFKAISDKKNTLYKHSVE